MARERQRKQNSKTEERERERKGERERKREREREIERERERESGNSGKGEGGRGGEGGGVGGRAYFRDIFFYALCSVFCISVSSYLSHLYICKEPSSTVLALVFTDMEHDNANSPSSVYQLFI